MKTVIIGGSGLIGSRLVAKLRTHGHDAVPASRATGVATLTGEGLDDVIEDAVVVDVTNAPPFEDLAVLRSSRRGTARAHLSPSPIYAWCRVGRR